MRLLDKANLALRGLAAHAVLAPIDALEDRAPLKVHQCDEHEREAEADGDVQGPLNGFFIFYLVSELLVVDDEGGIGRPVGLFAWKGVTACNDPDLVGAVELIEATVCDDFFDGFGLRLPEVGVKRADNVNFSALRDFFNGDLELHCEHLRPNVRPAGVLSLNVLQFYHAWALRILNSDSIHIRGHIVEHRIIIICWIPKFLVCWVIVFVQLIEDETLTLIVRKDRIKVKCSIHVAARALCVRPIVIVVDRALFF